MPAEIPPLERRWCPDCASPHDACARCPGPLLATGAERHGWRARIGTWEGPRIFGVVIAPVREIWRARILTFPDTLWTVPGGSVPMKFAGDCPSEAENRAVDFIRQHCRERGFAVTDLLPPAQPGALLPERCPEASISEDEQRSLRKLHAIPIRFGVQAPERVGMTHDLSEDGLFIVTDPPMEIGQRMKMRVKLGPFSIELDGTVRWTRTDRAHGRPLGMGVRLDGPPPAYLHYVRRLP